MDLRERTTAWDLWLERTARFRWPILLLIGLGLMLLAALGSGLLESLLRVMRTDWTLGSMGWVSQTQDLSAWLLWAPALGALVGMAIFQWRVIVLWMIMFPGLILLTLAPIPEWAWPLLLLTALPLASANGRLGAASASLGALWLAGVAVSFGIDRGGLETLRETGWIALGWVPAIAAIFATPLGLLSARLRSQPRRQAWAESWKIWALQARWAALGWILGSLTLLFVPEIGGGLLHGALSAFVFALAFGFLLLPAWTIILPWREHKVLAKPSGSMPTGMRGRP
jgi:hypothetical protein